MSVKPNQRYIGTVAAGSGFFEAMQKGTPGFQVLINTDDGATEYTIWLTTKTKESGNAARDFKTLGVSMEQLKDRAFRENLGKRIEGTELSLETFLDSYQGKDRVKVRWIAPATGGTTLDEAVASFFGDAPKQPSSYAVPPVDDDDVPF